MGTTDDARDFEHGEGDVFGEPFVEPPVRRSTYTPPPSKTEASGSASDAEIHDDDELARALEADFGRAATGAIPVVFPTDATVPDAAGDLFGPTIAPRASELPAEEWPTAAYAHDAPQATDAPQAPDAPQATDAPQAPPVFNPPIFEPPTFTKPANDLPQPPVDLPRPPVDLPQPPVDLPRPPVDLPQPPVDLPRPPVDLPQPPVDLPQPPADAPPTPSFDFPAPGSGFHVPHFPGDEPDADVEETDGKPVFSLDDPIPGASTIFTLDDAPAQSRSVFSLDDPAPLPPPFANEPPINPVIPPSPFGPPPSAGATPTFGAAPTFGAPPTPGSQSPFPPPPPPSPQSPFGAPLPPPTPFGAAPAQSSPFGPPPSAGSQSPFGPPPPSGSSPSFGPPPPPGAASPFGPPPTFPAPSFSPAPDSGLAPPAFGAPPAPPFGVQPDGTLPPPPPPTSQAPSGEPRAAAFSMTPEEQAAALKKLSAPTSRPWVPERKSLPDDRLMSMLEAAHGPSRNPDALSDLQAQLALRAEEAKEFKDWEESMKAVGTPEAIEAIEKVRPAFEGVVPQPPYRGPVDDAPVKPASDLFSGRPAAPSFDAPPAPAFPAAPTTQPAAEPAPQPAAEPAPQPAPLPDVADAPPASSEPEWASPMVSESSDDNAAEAEETPVPEADEAPADLESTPVADQFEAPVTEPVSDAPSNDEFVDHTASDVFDSRPDTAPESDWMQDQAQAEDGSRDAFDELFGPTTPPAADVSGTGEVDGRDAADVVPGPVEPSTLDESAPASEPLPESASIDESVTSLDALFAQDSYGAQDSYDAQESHGAAAESTDPVQPADEAALADADIAEQAVDASPAQDDAASADAETPEQRADAASETLSNAWEQPAPPQEPAPTEAQPTEQWSAPLDIPENVTFEQLLEWTTPASLRQQSVAHDVDAQDDAPEPAPFAEPDNTESDNAEPDNTESDNAESDNAEPHNAESLEQNAAEPAVETSPSEQPDAPVDPFEAFLAAQEAARREAAATAPPANFPFAKPRDEDQITDASALPDEQIAAPAEHWSAPAEPLASVDPGAGVEPIADVDPAAEAATSEVRNSIPELVEPTTPPAAEAWTLSSDPEFNAHFGDIFGQSSDVAPQAVDEATLPPAPPLAETPAPVGTPALGTPDLADPTPAPAPTADVVAGFEQTPPVSEPLDVTTGQVPTIDSLFGPLTEEPVETPADDAPADRGPLAPASPPGTTPNFDELLTGGATDPADPVFLEPRPFVGSADSEETESVVTPEGQTNNEILDDEFEGVDDRASAPLSESAMAAPIAATGTVGVIAAEAVGAIGTDTIATVEPVSAASVDTNALPETVAMPAPVFTQAVPVVVPAKQRAFRIELAGVEPTPLDQRVSRAIRLFWLWFAANSSIVSLALGGVIYGLGLNLRQALVAIVIGIALSCLPLGLGTLVGKRSGQPAMIVSRAVFGVIGNAIPAFISLLTRIAWGAALLWVLGFSVSAILTPIGFSGGLSQQTLTFVIMGIAFVIALLVAFFGYSLMARVQLVISILSAILIVGVIALTADRVDFAQAITTSDGSWALSLAATVMVFSFVGLSWANSAADLARYQQPGVGSGGAMITASFGAAVPTFVLMCYAAILAASDPQIAAGLAADPLATLASLLPAWYPIPLVAVTALGLLSGVIVTVYSGGFAIQSVGIRMPRQWSTVLVSVFIAAAAFLMSVVNLSLDELFRDVTTTLAVPVAAWVGMVAADTMVRRAPYDSASLLARGKRYPAVNWINLPAYLLITGVGFGLTSATLAGLQWQGYLLAPLGIEAGSDLASSDFGVVIALGLGLLIPLVTGVRGIRRQESQSSLAN